MGDDDDVLKALAFLRNHEAETTVTGAPANSAQLSNLDLDAINADFDDDLDRKTGHEPVGPNWKKPGSFAQLPKIPNHPDSAWLMHERQDQQGKYKPWLFFSKVNGEYYRINDSANGYTPMPTPHKPWAAPLIARAGNASVLAGGAGAAKLDMTVLLPDLQKTGFLLKQPLEFLDKPASLFVLCAGLRGSSAAAEFCAKRFHAALLPKLSSKPTTWYDKELMGVIGEAAKAVDKQLLESPACFAGCSLAVALLSGCRLAVASLGSARCLLCRPTLQAPEAKRPAAGAAAQAPAPWTARVVAGTGLHALSQESEAQRVEAAACSCPGLKVAGGEADGPRLYSRSIAPAALASIEDEWEREFQRVTRATNSFAVLGLTPKLLSEGAASLRKQFRRKSLIVHPDKVGEERRQRSTEIFSRMEAAINLVEGMLQADAAAAALLAEVHCAHDGGRLGSDAGVAAALLGVAEGCASSEASKAAKKKFEGPLNKLQNVSRQDVERALQILEVAQESASRGGAQLWTPPEADVGVRVTRALGCKDLKAPVRLLSNDLSVEMVQLGVNEVTGLALLAEGAEALPDAAVAQRLAAHAPGRPRAAALRIALDGARAAGEAAGTKRKAISAVCAYFRGEALAGDATGSSEPPAKRQRSGLPDRVRMSHILLRWAGIKGGDDFERPNMPPPKRTQADAERELLELAEKLLAARDPKTLQARFKAMVMKHSECQTALNVPHADLGWLEPGGSEPAFEVAAFDTPLGGLSDVVVTSRGAHLMYRLG